ncbi:MAG TPA: metal-sensing transcriptional repressor, partial [Gammaproteobacteria bacterium]|nr:metal-sensing transcriptional repressor [Gammaproteobacteria bacterium]
AEGHLASVIAMIEQERPCLDLAQQLHAVEKSIHVAKETLIHDHIEHCLTVSTRGPSSEAARALEEFKQITKYL